MMQIKSSIISAVLFMTFLFGTAGCSVPVKSDTNENNPSVVSKTSGTIELHETNTTQNTDKSAIKRDCILDDKGNLLVMTEDSYQPYTYDKFPEIPGSFAQIVEMLGEGDNIVKFYYRDKLHLLYGLEESKCQIVGGNGVDIFNFTIDKEQDIIAFSIENLTFYDVIEDDYRPQLLETFNLLFGINGEDIYRYFMPFYEHPIDGVTDETRINEMRVTYWCSPKHRLVVYLADDK